MRSTIRPFWTLGLLLGLLGQAGAQDEARAVIEKAIKASGGAELIAKHKAARTKTKGTLETMGLTLAFTQEISSMLPDKFKEVLQLEVMGQQVNVVTVFNGTKGAITANGQDIPVSDAILDALKEQKHVGEVARLLPLLSDKSFELSLVGEVQVANKPAVGVRVTKKGAKDISLFFDKGSGLLAKLEHRTVDPMSGQEFTEERIVLEYQQFEGAPVAKKVQVNRDGKKFMEIEILEVKFPDTIDENEFNK